MKTNTWMILFLLLFTTIGEVKVLGENHLQISSQAGDSSKILRRADSFLGFHFDFHANEDCDKIGKMLTESMIDSFLILTKPDYIQVDSKGHAGYSSYPTKVGNRAPGYEKDPLDIFRKVTARHYVGLYAHYSGIWDKRAVQLHPEWSIINEDGSIPDGKLAYAGPYIDELLIPQLKEIAAKGLDGVWVDGDCWASLPDYSEYSGKRYTAETGEKNLPKKGEKGFKKFLEFNRKELQKYIKKYIDEVHKEYPDFQITSNWAYSSLMPEEVSSGMDYLSGDMAGMGSVYSAAWDGRCLAGQGLPWDLMAWGFNTNPKSLTMLQQEAAQVISLGGGFQVYYGQNRDASLKKTYFDRMAKLASWCRARQETCFKSKAIPQIALWYSTYAWKKAQDKMYSYNESDRMAQTLSMLLDGRQSVEVLMDHHLKETINKYPLIVLPEWTDVGNEMKQLVLDYVKNGGNLLITGASATTAFHNELGVKPVDKQNDGYVFFYSGKDQYGSTHTKWQKIETNPAVKVIGLFMTSDDPDYFTTGKYPMATIAGYGKGKIAGIYCDLSGPYMNMRSSYLCKMVNHLVNELLPEPLVKVEGDGDIHLVLAEKNNQWIANIINVAGGHYNFRISAYDSIQPTGTLTLHINTNKYLKEVIVEPEKNKLQVRRISENKYSVTIPPVAIHSAVVFSFDGGNQQKEK
ncbi:MAG: hypothetical protein LBU57_09180 [Dysgonamonadaceae bacterium]|jgi:hypothetical protein|nr:hypothetical protein [Dysgonamonadaceae bacterium]